MRPYVVVLFGETGVFKDVVGPFTLKSDALLAASRVEQPYKIRQLLDPDSSRFARRTRSER